MNSPAHRVPDMSWFAWGDPEQAAPLSDSVRDLVAQALGAELRARPPVAESEVRIPASALPEAARADLLAVVGTGHLLDDAAARLRHSGGKSTPDLLRRRSGDASNAPDAVLLPADHDEVLAVLAACSAHRVAVVPFGGGTSVVGGVEPERGGFGAVIALDLRRLDRLVDHDPVSMTATLQAGLRTPEAEELLAERGCTLGHLPQSYEFATIGGYAATRSSGQASSGYGRFDDMVVALKAATPSGTVELGRAPASAAGPDLRQLLLGSEGVFGVITEVTVRVRPVPADRSEEAWSFPGFAAGTEALRRLAQSALRPSTARLSDETETFVNAALSGERAEPGCRMVIGFDGTAEDVAARRAAAAEVLAHAGGAPLGAEAVGEWRHTRFHGPYLRDALLGAGVLSETLETATSWTKLAALDTAVRAAVSGALDGADGDEGGAAIVLCHVSHTYPTGASLYYTVVAPAGADPLARWAAAKHAAGDAIAANGGTISHHHAVGADHRPWMGTEVGPLGVSVLRAVKRTLDPVGVLNPGKLIPEE